MGDRESKSNILLKNNTFLNNFFKSWWAIVCEYIYVTLFKPLCLHINIANFRHTFFLSSFFNRSLIVFGRTVLSDDNCIILPVKMRKFTTITQILRTFPFPRVYIGSSLSRGEHLLFLDVRSMCAIHLFAREPYDVYVRLRGCRSHQEEAKKRRGARAMRKKIPPLRPRAAKVWNDREARKRSKRRGSERKSRKRGSALRENRARGDTRMFNVSH